MATADVTIMGAGIFGLSMAYSCARRDARVRVIDPRGVAAGASGGPVGALAPHTPENWNAKKQFQLESLLMAPGYWADVEAISGLTAGYGRIGRLQAIDDERALDLARKRSQGAEDLWRGEAEWQVRLAQGGWEPNSATGQLVYDTLSARINPKLACQSLAGAIRALGGNVGQEHDEIDGATVWATGYEGLLEMSQQRDATIGNGVKGQALVLDHDAGDAPQLYADGLHIVPHANGTVAVGSTSERDFDNPSNTDDLLDQVHARAVAICPLLTDAKVLHRWAGVRPRAKSRAPMLGAWPNRPGHFIANGGFKIGFGMAPKVGEVMAELVLEGRNAIPEGFRIEDNF